MPQQPSHALHTNHIPISPPAEAAGADPRRQGSLSLVPLFALAFLTYNSIASICRSIHDTWTVSFVVVSYVDLLLLYYCFRLMERTAAADVWRLERLKGAVWALSFILTALLSYRVAFILPPVFAVIVWAFSAVTVFGGFYVLFLQKEAPEKEANAAGKIPDAFEKC